MRFVAVRFVAKKFVVVADVPVAFSNVKFCKVEEPLTKRFVELAVPNIVSPWVPFPIVEEAETMMPTVVVGARYPFTRFQVFPKLFEERSERVFPVNESPAPIVVP